MGGTKKHRPATPSVAPLFRAKSAGPSPPSSSELRDPGSDSDASAPQENRSAAATKADLHHLLLEIRSSMSEELEKQLRPLREDLRALDVRTEALEQRSVTTTTTIGAQEAQMRRLADKVCALESEMEDLNNRNRRNNIRLRGLPETVLPEDLLTAVRAIFSTLLPDASASDLHIDRAHRALRAPNLTSNQPRDVIIRLHHFTTKECLMAAARDAAPYAYGAQLSLFQDLCPATLQKRRALRPLTALLTAQHIRYAWGFPFRLLVRKDSQLFVLHDIAEMETFAAELGIPLPAPAGRPSPHPEGLPRRRLDRNLRKHSTPSSSARTPRSPAGTGREADDGNVH